MSNSHRPARVVMWLAAVALGAVTSSTVGQNIDQDAAKAFEKMIEAYRERPALGVKAVVSVELKQGDMISPGGDVEAEFLFNGRERALISLRGFRCVTGHGELIAVHDENEHSYYRGPDDGSPYYALFTAFLDMPFPHLAIYLGEDAMEDLYMQIHPIAPEIVPTAVARVETDGAASRKLVLSSDNATLELMLDPDTQLINSATLQITGGPLVQPGVTMTYTHEFEYETFDEPLPEERFALNTRGRQRVTMLATLQPKPAMPEPIDPGAAPMPGGGGGALAGRPAPEFTLDALDGEPIDLGELRGQVVILDFWATWCGPCVKGLPLLHDVAAWARNEQLPVKVFTVNTFEGATLRNDSPDARRDSARRFWERHKFTLPVLLDFSDQTAASYGVSAIPTTVVIRADGVVHAVHTGLSADLVDLLQGEVMEAIDAVEAVDD